MKRILAFLLSTLLLLGLCACGSGEQATGKPAQPGTSTLPLSSGAETEWVTKSKEYRPFPAGISIRDLARIGDSLLISLSDGGTFSDGGRHSLALCRYSIAEDGSPLLSDPQEIPLDEPSAPEEDFLYDLAPGADSCFYVLTGERPATYLHNGELQFNEARQNSYRVLHYSQEGELLSSLPLISFEIQDLRGLAALDEEHILLYGDVGLALLNSAGQILHRELLDAESYTVGAQRCGESLYLTRFQPTGQGLYLCCDLRTGETRELSSGNADTLNSGDGQGLENEYLREFLGTIFALDPESGSEQELLRWNYRNEGCSQVLRLSDHAYLCRQDRSSVLTGAWEVQQAVRERENVKVAIYCVDDFLGLASTVRSALQGFENESGLYTFEVTEYGEDELDKLFTLLTTSDAPDLVIFNQGINTASTAFLDLYPLLDKDQELSRESFLPLLLQDLSIKGELHELWTEVNVCTLSARVSDVGDGKGLTTADYDRILSESDQYQAIFQGFMDKVNLLRYVSTVGISRYVNREDGSCSFDDPSFRELLAWCSKMCDEQPEGSFDSTVLYPEDVVLWVEWMQTPSRVHMMRDNVYHEPFVFVGFPTGDDLGSYYTMAGWSMAIPAAASNLEGAWAFLRSRLILQEQLHLRFPVNREAAETLAREDGAADEDMALLLDLLEHTGFAENIADASLREIVMDCGLAYLHGEKSLDEAIDLLQSRASIYMAERYG